MLIPQHVVFYLYQESCKLRAHVRLIVVYPEQKQVVVPVKHVSYYQGGQGGRAACFCVSFQILVLVPVVQDEFQPTS